MTNSTQVASALDSLPEAAPSSVGPVPSIWRRTVGVPVLLFCASILTTMAIGARFMENFRLGLPTIAEDSDLWPWPWLYHHQDRFLLGWPFSLTLLSILLAHEFGHYFACRIHRIPTTLPLLLPAPTLSGTAGAVILIRGRIPNRHALIDVGIWGPIAGYAASLIAIVLGFVLSRPMPSSAPEPLVRFGQPATFLFMHRLLAALHAGVPRFTTGLVHPVLLAGWIGLFITALNLIPAGQLDGGHILYAFWPRIHRPATLAIAAVLIVCGFFFWVGWAFWGLLMLLPAMRHPRVPIDRPLGPWRAFLSISGFLLFALTFTAEPFLGSSLLHYLR